MRGIFSALYLFVLGCIGVVGITMIILFICIIVYAAGVAFVTS